MTLTSWTTYKWTDSRLSWDPSKNNDISEIKFNYDQVWNPDVSYFDCPIFTNFWYAIFIVRLFPTISKSQLHSLPITKLLSIPTAWFWWSLKKRIRFDFYWKHPMKYLNVFTHFSDLLPCKCRGMALWTPKLHLQNGILALQPEWRRCSTRRIQRWRSVHVNSIRSRKCDHDQRWRDLWLLHWKIPPFDGFRCLQKSSTMEYRRQ